MDSPRRANQGLHLTHEHPVITRDMQMPKMKPLKQKKGQFKPDLDLKIKGWNMSGDYSQGGLVDASARMNSQRQRQQDGPLSQFVDIVDINTRHDKDFFEQRKFSQEAGSENFHIYSQTQLQQLREDEAQSIHVSDRN